MTKTVQLHCPSTRQSVDNFVVSPFQTHEQVMQGIRLRLGINHAALYTVDAKHITNLESLQEDQRILVAASSLERMLPDAPSGFALYDGEEGEVVDPAVEGFGQPWDDLTEREKCDHIISVMEQQPTTRNKLRITRPYQSVQSGMISLQSMSSTEAEANIDQRWRTTIEHFLPDALKPNKVKTSGKFWDGQVIAALSVLSSFTHGQSRLARDFLEEAVTMRVDNSEGDDEKSSIVQTQDVLDAIALIYERAGVVPAKLTKHKSAKMKEKERRKALKERKKVEAKDRVVGTTA
ncbi:Nn.00g048020.m01.CDS01 [Neocucurbitaria sp. VM-36]